MLVAGGGTGGHLFPGLAVADALAARAPGAAIAFAGTERGLEFKVIPRTAYRLYTVPVYGLVGKGLWRRVLALTLLPAALQAASRILGEFRPDLVIGVGGYASAPLLFAAGIRRIPRVILEQNAVPGLTNRIFGPQVERVFLAFEAARERFKPNARGNRDHISCPGNPVRAQLLAATPVADPAAPHLLVFGGSQGAAAINDAMLAGAPALFRALPGLTVTHQTGRVEHTQVQNAYAAMGGAVASRVTVLPFIDDMAAAYARATLVLCRAGATSTAELTALGKPAVLVPYPHAAHGHQAANARALADAGAAVHLDQADLSGSFLVATVTGLLGERGRLDAMATAARALGRPDAAGAIADACLSLIAAEPT